MGRSWKQDLIEDTLEKGFVVYGEVDACFPEICRYSTQGFIDYIVKSVLEMPFEVTSERQAPTRIAFFGRPPR